MLTIVYLLLFGGAVVAIYAIPLWADLYARVVVLSVLFAIGLLYVLSIPRKIELTHEAVEIRCVVEITRIQLSELRSVRRLNKSDMNRKMVLLGSFGFFGYYGYYLDLKTLETVVLYCTEWDNFVEFTDVYEKKYIVSCNKPEELVEAVRQALEYRMI